MDHVCYDQPYSHATTQADLDACQGAGVTHVLVGAKASAGASTLALLAAGRASQALAPTSSTGTAYAENGAYWYNFNGRSSGFADSSSIWIGPSDSYSRVNGCHKRLSWLRQTGWGGWRAGCTLNLENSATWRKVMYSWITDETSGVCTPAYATEVHSTCIST